MSTRKFRAAGQPDVMAPYMMTTGLEYIRKDMISWALQIMDTRLMKSIGEKIFE